MSEENVEAARRFVEDHWPDGVVAVEYVDAGGDAVVLVCGIEVEVKGTIHTHRHGSVFEIRDRKVVDWRPYPSEQAAREAAGLSE